MFKRIACFSLLGALLISPTLADTDILVEDFESYESDAAMRAVWVPNGTLAQDPFLFDFNTTGQPWTAITPPDPGSVDGKAVFFDGTSGGIAKYANALSVAPSATQNVELTAYLGHDMTSTNKRLSVGLRYTDAATENLIEIGFYNSFVGPNGEFLSFGFRTALMPGNTNWQPYALPEDMDQLFEIGDPAFHTFKATVSLEDITFTLDLFGDGINNSTGESGLDATNVVPAVATTNGFNDLRFGGPSGVTSPAPFLGVDNISLRLVDVVIEPPVGDADFNGDGKVDGRDFLIWQRGFGTPDALLQDGDANEDNLVDGLDLEVWQDQYGDIPLVAAVTVPEPTAGALILAAMTTLLALKRR